MEKKIMIAVDGSIQARHAVDYAVAMADVIRPLSMTLYHVQPQISQYLEEEARSRPQAAAQLNTLVKKNAEAADRMLDDMRQAVVLGGIDAARVDTLTRPRTTQLDRVILREAEERQHDALVLGQRGISGFQKAFIDSVSAGVMQQPASLPIWLVKGKVASPGKILMAVDGSRNAFRAVDHLAFILSGNTDLRLTFFHVRPNLIDVCPITGTGAETDHLDSAAADGDRHCMDDFLNRALARLKDAGIGEDRVDVETADKMLQIGKAILEKADRGGFGTVVVGRRGLTRTFFTGSVSGYLIDRLSDRALWVVQ